MDLEIGDLIFIVDNDKTGRIVGFDEDQNKFEVINLEDDKFELENVKLYNNDQLKLFRREYKIVRFSECSNPIDDDIMLYAQLTPISHLYSFTGMGVNDISMVNPNIIHKIVIPRDSDSFEIVRANPEESFEIDFQMSMNKTLFLDGEKLDVVYLMV